jgi:hypothetical protein
VGYVTWFRVRAACLQRYPVCTAGAAQHREYWIAAEDLAACNAQLVGPIGVIATFRGAAATPS